MNVIPTTIVLVLMLATLAGLIALQIFLSRREASWPGLILPILSLLVSILNALNIVMPAEPTAWEIISMVGSAFLLSNISTVVYLGIYFACREKQRRKKQMEKMNIQDLDG